MGRRSKPSFIAEALARGDIDLIRSYGRRGGRASAEKRTRKHGKDQEDDLYEQVMNDASIERSPGRRLEQKNNDEEYVFGGHL